MNHLTVILGCMFSQKTTELVRRVRQEREKGFQVLVVNSCRDTRYQVESEKSQGEEKRKGEMVTHDGEREEAMMVSSLAEVNHLVVGSPKYRMIAIDEGQFFPDLFLYVTQWADEQQIQILVAGLDGTFEREPFGDMLRLIPHAEEVVRLHAQCSYCPDGKGKAIYSRRKKATESKGTVMVGGAEAYEPVCRFHYHALAYKDRVEK